VNVVIGRIKIAGTIYETVRPLGHPNTVLRQVPEIGPRAESGMKGLHADEQPLDAKRRLVENASHPVHERLRIVRLGCKIGQR